MGSRRTRPHAAVRLVAQPASVPAARRFVSDALDDWGCATLADDVGLCVSELATNATLHSGTSYFQIELEKRSDAVRLAVADAGMEAVDVLARQPELSDAFVEDLTADDASATGRGLFLVSVLAATWGIEELPAGKRVWAEFHPEDTVEDAAEVAPAAEPTPAQVTHSTVREPPALDPDAFAVVRFRAAPAALVLAHDDNLADYTRELQLMGDRLSEPSLQRLASMLNTYVTQHSANWDAARIIVHEALREGHELVDVDFLATRDIRESLRVLRGMVGEAEALSRTGRLMTLPAAEPVQQVRDWMEGEFLAQIEDGAEPLPWPEWLAGVRR